MGWAKPCKYCGVTQVVWDDKLEGSNKYKEVKTNLPHTRDRCDEAKESKGGVGKYTRQQEKEFVDYYRPPQPQKSETQPQPLQKPREWTSEKLDVIEAQIQRLDAKVAKIIEWIDTSVLTNKDDIIAQQRQKITELEEALKKVGLVQKASDMNIQQDQEDFEHMQRMVKKGSSAAEEELEL